MSVVARAPAVAADVAHTGQRPSRERGARDRYAGGGGNARAKSLTRAGRYRRVRERWTEELQKEFAEKHSLPRYRRRRRRSRRRRSRRQRQRCRRRRWREARAPRTVSEAKTKTPLVPNQ